nr:MAG TPA: hypothetical protein [Caudoviricetes sp.]
MEIRKIIFRINQPLWSNLGSFQHIPIAEMSLERIHFGWL